MQRKQAKKPTQVAAAGAVIEDTSVIRAQRPREVPGVENSWFRRRGDLLVLRTVKLALSL